MLGLTILGGIHTAISLVALIAGYYALALDGLIQSHNRLGKVYLWATTLTCLTGFGIFQHGGFGKPHALGILTLLVLAVALWAGGAARSTSAWRYVATLGFTFTLFLHMVPGLTETFTRVPLGSPLFDSPDDPNLAQTVGAVFLAFLVIMAFQVRHLRKESTALLPRRNLA